MSFISRVNNNQFANNTPKLKKSVISKNNLKITAFVTLLLVASINGANSDSKCINDICDFKDRDSYQENVLSNISAYDPTEKAFPTYLPRMMNLGKMLNPNGDSACYFTPEEKHFSLSKCDGLAQRVKMYIELDLLSITQEQKDIGFREKGIPIFLVSPEAPDVAIGFNPKKMLGYSQALGSIKKDVLDNPDFFSQEPKLIVGFFKKIYAQACQYYVGKDNNPLNIDKFRKYPMIVYKEDKPRESIEEIIHNQKLKGASKKTLRHLKTALKKMQKYGAIELLSRNERSAFQLLAYIPPNPEKIEGLMFEFASSLKDNYLKMQQGKMHPIALAAWTHQQIAKIHPFDDGNGLNARLWMNTILELGGYESIFFDSDENYTYAIEQDAKEPGYFASYLSKMVKESRSKSFA